MYTVLQQSQIGGGATQFLRADCEPGDKATGGGFNAQFGGGIDLRAVASLPQIDIHGTPVGWLVAFVNGEANSRFIATFVVCAAASP